MKLLVVEANERVSAALGAALEEQGLQAVCASTGRVALELLDRARPDVVLLDLALPDCDGFGLCGAMRAASTVPILVTTARGDHLSCVRALDLGADDHLVKPYNLAELLARARAVLRRGRLAEPATTDSGTAPAAAVPDEPFEEPPTDLLLAGRVRVDLRSGPSWSTVPRPNCPTTSSTSWPCWPGSRAGPCAPTRSSRRSCTRTGRRCAPPCRPGSPR
ncbi:response regulator transcription factor [Streptomyces sp. INA 01156]